MGKNMILGMISMLMPLQAFAADQSIFTSQKPVLTGMRDGVNYELGMRFLSAKSGQIKAIRFYKSPGENGAHVGKIYSASGRVVATVNFSNESPSGWQQQALNTPITIAANTEYVVSVNTGNQYYVATNNGFASQIVNGDLKSAGGRSGVYGPVGSKPTNSYLSSNYFRDVVFAANSGSTTPPPTNPNPTPEDPGPVVPVPAGDGPPLSFNDARFTSGISNSTVSVPNGGSLIDRGIRELSGGSTIVCQGSCNLTRVRVDSRECIRGVQGNIVITDSYLEATGSGDDHADVIQTYSPGSHGKLILRNTSIVAHNTSATAGIFVADHWNADLVDLENVMFSGGPYGLRLHADGYTGAHLRMKNVCFVGPFLYGKFIIDGFIIDEWTNVNECVIQNGKLVITKAISRP